MVRKVVYVTPIKTKEGLNWKVLTEKSERPVKITENKIDAIVRAREIAKNATLGQIKIQNKFGDFQTEYTYGSDSEKYQG